MDRLTYDFPFNGGHCWQIHGADNLECREVCERQGENGCIECPIAKAFDRLAAYENTGLEPEEIEELYIKIFKITGFTVEKLLDMFLAGYTLKSPYYNEAWTWSKMKKYLNKGERSVNRLTTRRSDKLDKNQNMLKK